MAEYIKRNELAKWLKDESDSYSMKDVAPVGWTLIGLINELSKIPSADVAERKHGKWIIVDKYSDYRTERCSACGFVANRTYIRDIWSFCPNCGADMRGGEDGLL